MSAYLTRLESGLRYGGYSGLPEERTLILISALIPKGFTQITLIQSAVCHFLLYYITRKQSLESQIKGPLLILKSIS